MRRQGVFARLLTVLLCVLTIVLPVGCGVLQPSDEPVAVIPQAMVTSAPPLSELDPILSASKVPTGSLPGVSAVSAAGGYEYSIPLDVPPGRAGMQPKLSLRYSSGAGIDNMGAGWSVAGATSIIKPCTPTFATHGHVDFPTKLCLDQQPLIELGSTGEYRTENDSFAQVLAQPPSAS
ncbi:MAG: hypothetical protein HUU21_24420, partial [Polyangiaceae bacterium]|nr:hypothetical protein [Polyangiaceae bacterium]